jgi:hypothetical protein
MIRAISRRLERLELSSAATTQPPLLMRIRLVHAEKGVTGVLVIESGHPPMLVPPTSEDIESFGRRTRA